MKAVAALQYGSADQLQIIDLPTPEPGPNEVRVRVRAAGLNPFDAKMITGSLKALYPMRFPWVPGHDVCGVVEAVGPGARHRAAVGQRVVVLCHLKSVKGKPSAGAFAEQVIVLADDLVAAPVNLSDTEAAALPMAAVTAVRCLRKEAQLKAGQRVLITGAAGGVGHFAVQVAKALGLVVTASAKHAAHDFVRSLGADEIIDYTATDVTTLGERFDAVIDAAASLSYAKATKLLVPDGTYVSTLPNLEIILRHYLGSLVSSRRCRFLAVNQADEHLKFAATLVETGKLRPMIAASFPMRETTAAIAQLNTGGTQGKIVLTPSF